jgi:hypothetical protein
VFITLQRYNKKLKVYLYCQRIFHFHKPCESFLFVGVLGNIYLCADFIEIVDYIELNKKEEKHEEKNDFSVCDGCHGYGFEGAGQSGVA